MIFCGKRREVWTSVRGKGGGCEVGQRGSRHFVCRTRTGEGDKSDGSHLWTKWEKDIGVGVVTRSIQEKRGT